MQGTFGLDLPVDLDNRLTVTELDPKGMLKLTEDFPRQCREALAIVEAIKFPLLDRRPGSVVVTGMGGSAAGGDFVKALFDQQGAVPMIVNRDYGLPPYLGVGDIVFCCSYSGNTEETLSAYASAKKAGAKVISVTSGGKLKEISEADGFTVITVPGGQPPRTALGYLLIPVIYACQKFRLIHEQDFVGAIDLLESTRCDLTVEAKGNPAKQLAEKMRGAVPILYGLGSWQGLVANRWRCQINENAKQLAFSNAYPELDHNEVLGWVEANKLGVDKFVGIVLEDGTETAKMKARASISESLIGSNCPFIHIQAQGDTLLKRMLTLAYFGDFVSIYLARLNGVDPENIDWLIQLKEELGRIES